PVGNHLRDREAKHQIGKVFLTTGYHGLRYTILQNDDVVTFVQLESVVARVSKRAEERARNLGEFRAQGVVQIASKVTKCVVQLVVHKPLAVQDAQPFRHSLILALRGLRRIEALLRSTYVALGPDDYQLAGSRRFSRALVVGANSIVRGLREL